MVYGSSRGGIARSALHRLDVRLIRIRLLVRLIAANSSESTSAFITTHMVIVAIRYMIQTITSFGNTDERGIEEIMYGIQREVINRMMDCAVILIIDTLLDSIRECFGTTEDQINRLVCVFISKLREV